MPYVLRLEKGELVFRPSIRVGLLRTVSDFLNFVDIYAVLCRPFIVFPFF